MSRSALDSIRNYRSYQTIMILFVGCLSLCLLGSCSSNTKNQKNTSEISASDTLPGKLLPKGDTALMKLKEFVGQYPSDVKFLDQPELKQRLEDLLGSQYTNFRKYWQTETPIEVEDNVLSTTGCEVHNCAANQFVLQIDLAHNNINVYHLGQGIQSYLEKGPIQLPPGLSKEFNTISGNSQ